MNKLQLIPSPRNVNDAAVMSAGLPHADGVALMREQWQAVLGGEHLSASELAGLQRLAQVQRAEVGALVLRRQQPADHLVAVLQGSVGLGLSRDDEPFHLERTVRGPQWLDVSSAWLGTAYAQDARAITEARLLWLPRQELRVLMQNSPAMSERLLLALARQVHSLTHVTHDLMHKDAERRLSAWLLQLCEGHEAANPGGVVTLALKERKRDIAAQLAITPETLSRMIRQLTRKGVVNVQGYTVKVLDLSALQQLARD